MIDVKPKYENLNQRIKRMKEATENLEQQKTKAKKKNLVQKKPCKLKKGEEILMEDFAIYKRNEYWDPNTHPYFHSYIDKFIPLRRYLKIIKIEKNRDYGGVVYFVHVQDVNKNKYLLKLDCHLYYWVRQNDSSS